MDLKKFLTDSRAVSPVIGVILMVAITVILAAVIGTFVLGLGDQIGDTTPQASFSFEYDGANSMNVTHESGESINGDQLEAVGSGVNVVDGDDAWDGMDVSAGTTVELELDAPLDEGDSVRIVWTSESGANSATLQKYTQ